MNELTTPLKDRIETIIREEIEKGKEALIQWWIIQKRIMYRCGLEVLKDYPELEENRSQGGRGVTAGFRQVAREIEQDRGTISRWIKLIKRVKRVYKNDFDTYAQIESEEAFNKWRNGMLEDKAKRVIDTANMVLPEGKYYIIYADPPWQYDFSQSQNRSIEAHYPTLTVDQIIEYQDKYGISITDKFNDDSILFLWATAPKIQEALIVIQGWGYEYKTHAMWDKEKIGMGYWFRGQHEILTVSTRGEGKPPPQDKRFPSVFRFPRDSKHSRKPSRFYEIIEQMYPININQSVHLECFQREPRTGWRGFGNELSTSTYDARGNEESQ